MSELRILNHKGDTLVEWKVGTESEAEARKAFDEIMASGHRLAYRVDAGVDEGEQIHDFEATATTIFIVPQIVGG